MVLTLGDVAEGSLALELYAWLAEGNTRFCEGVCRAWMRGPVECHRAIVITCACLPEPEILFDQRPGTFVVHQGQGLRVDASTMAVVHYGTTVLDVPGIVVVDHEGCPFRQEPDQSASAVARALRGRLGPEAPAILDLHCDRRSAVQLAGTLSVD